MKVGQQHFGESQRENADANRISEQGKLTLIVTKECHARLINSKKQSQKKHEEENVTYEMGETKEKEKMGNRVGNVLHLYRNNKG